MPKYYPVKMEFHVSRQSRDRYQFGESLFSLRGNVVFANFHASRVFAQKMNAKRDLVHFPEQVVRAGQINAMGLIDEILHVVVGQYRQQRNPQVMEHALAWLNENIGPEAVDKVLRQFVEEFPPLAVYQREINLDEYLAGVSDLPGGVQFPNRQIVLEELVMLWLANANPAFAPYLELFDDSALEKGTAYPEVIPSLHDFFETQPKFGPENQNLIDMLRSPAIAVPHSLTGQLEYIRTRWSILLGKYLYRLLSSLDLIKEEEKAIFGVGGGGPARVYDFTGQELEIERFSPDRDWMPNLVLIAKNSYVWLDQLSKKYKRPINRLDEIPDEELDTLARWGFSGLWLIGLWERSSASKKIKQLRGNPDAVASAYSLFSYDIAADLGGEEAYTSLRDRSWKRGIRLASDMVPNHMGIDSRWVVEHPDWFISLDYSPFPSYSFNGPDLSWDERVGIQIDDHYYNNTDAAVAFKRVDKWTGSQKFVYHGNDGTSMPWNDTAQLNYLNPEVREAVIQTILHVARKFPVIRFDAAMTLAKKHFHRLWFPEPGSGGDIPSRAEYGLTKDQFDAAFPQEFWREVVDRVAQEVPDTLLLAEAFWLMEGYFVRTLGMHRVYNSAFMNMLRDEKNQEYRLVIKNTIEFDPEILKRYVNFMNNPDERTAVNQFGKEDKYFGICTLMATMPGLPMFGHGQVEGYTEKYGMEFRRAYWDERPDASLVERHEREIFPLMRRRYLFAGVENFLLYDFYNPEGNVNEDVFAYSNRSGGERSLVISHNKYAEARGWIRISAAMPVKGQERKLVQKNLGEGLGLRNDWNVYTIFRDHIGGLEYIRNNEELHKQGLYAELSAYQYQVFLDFREVEDNEWRQYAQLAQYLNGRGVPNIDEALKEIFLQPIHQLFRKLINAGSLQWLIDNHLDVKTLERPNLQAAFDEAEQKMLGLLSEIKSMTGAAGDEANLAAETRRELAALLALPALGARFPLPKSPEYTEAVHFLLAGPTPSKNQAIGGLDKDQAVTWGPLLGWIFTHKLGKLLDQENFSEQSRTWVDEWLLGKLMAAGFKELGQDEAAAWRAVGLVKLLMGLEGWHRPADSAQDLPYQALNAWLKNIDIQSFLGVNRYQGALWFNQEAFDELLWWAFAVAVVEITASEQALTLDKTGPTGLATSGVAEAILTCYDTLLMLQKAEAGSAYQVEKLLDAAKGKANITSKTSTS
jgi:glycosidase